MDSHASTISCSRTCDNSLWLDIGVKPEGDKIKLETSGGQIIRYIIMYDTKEFRDFGGFLNRQRFLIYSTLWTVW